MSQIPDAEDDRYDDLHLQALLAKGDAERVSLSEVLALYGYTREELRRHPAYLEELH